MKIAISKNNIRRQFSLIVVITLFSFSSCRKFIEIEPPVTNISTEAAFKTDLTAAAVLTGVYAQIFGGFNNPGSVYGTSYFSELSADNLTLFDPNNISADRDFYMHEINPENPTYWTETYRNLYGVNISLFELEKSTTLSQGVKQRLMGEAYFCRAFFYFYLVNMFGEVPLALTPDHKVTSKLARTSTSDVYGQINADLQNAESLLDLTYVGSDVSMTTSNRLRPNLAAVNALQARVFLYQKKYAEAESAASKVIAQSTLYSLAKPENAFAKNSLETIWALQPTTIGYNTREGQTYLLPPTGPDWEHPAYLSDDLILAFENGDARRSIWVNEVTVTEGTADKTYRFATKYKQGNEPDLAALNEYAIVLRLSEQYLIRAEARNELGNVSGAISDLNALRDKRRAEPTDLITNPLPVLSSTLTKAELSPLILHERQVELFTEWGHRWFDLKRTGKVTEVMTPVSVSRGGIAWSAYQQLYPIPENDIRINNSLTQNQGYSN